MHAIDDSIRKVLNGELEHYRNVVDACEPRVRAVVAAMIPDPNLVPDLTQEVFIIAYRRLADYRPGTNFTAWLRAIARNVARNERRRWYRKREMEERYRTAVEEYIEDDIAALVEALPEDMLESLQDCVARLNDNARTLVDGFYYGEEPIRQLAARLRISANAAKVILHRARQAIGRCLRRKDQCNVP